MTINSFGINADVAPVCCGDKLEINCTVPGRVLEWTVSLLPPEDTTFKSAVDSVSPSIQPHTQTVSNGSISFIISRISPPGNTHPLVSRLLISPATSVVNGTIVVCADRETRANSSTTVNVVHNNSPLTDNAVQGRSVIIILLKIIKTGPGQASLQSKCTGYGTGNLACYSKTVHRVRYAWPACTIAMTFHLRASTG